MFRYSISYASPNRCSARLSKSYCWFSDETTLTLQRLPIAVADCDGGIWIPPGQFDPGAAGAVMDKYSS
jgi:hypothetical protein